MSLFETETFRETRRRIAAERWHRDNSVLRQVALAATTFLTSPLDRCYLCNRPFRTFETFYVVKVWADGEEGFYGDKRGKCESCRVATFPPATAQWDRRWITRLK